LTSRYFEVEVADVRWDPEQYLRFADERGRPFRDLVTRVAAREPRVVVDLGCGPGNLTLELAARWPGARVEGVDNSAEMIERARAEVGDEVTLTLADAREWTPDEPVDVLVSNATLQWIPEHLPLLDRLAGFLTPGGWLAFQVPGNFGAPSHTELAAQADAPRWRDRLRDRARPRSEEPVVYLERLAGLGLQVDVWETTYLQVLPGEDAVLEWMRGTGLRPVLSALPLADRADFEADYAARLRGAYPRRPWGTVLPYRRIFVVAQR
jgi:trans-aconitate 2-methyltransferase